MVLWGLAAGALMGSTDNLSVKRITLEYIYPITNPITGKKYPPPKGRSYATKKSVMDKLIKDNRIYFGRDGKGAPQLKRYLNEVQQGVVPITWWDRKFAGDNQDAKQELNQIFGGTSGFETPKPVKLIKRVLQISSKKNSIILDFFGGSGTTGHAVLELNKEDGGNRKFILCTNNENNICTQVCYPRIKKVMNGYTNSKKKKIKGLGGNLKYFKTDFVDAKNNRGNIKKLAQASTEMLCLKEDCFDLVLKKKDSIF